MKLLFVNGSRGEWGYIRPIIEHCKRREIEYGICATNMLMLASHGNLLEEIRKDDYRVSDEIYMSLEGHNHFSMAKSLGVFIMSFTDTLLREKPDWVVLAGDRGEMMAAAIAAAYTYTPIAHIQAGERSGNIDGLARHAIGKFVHLHFAANQDAADRLLRLGEEPFRIHNVGAPQLDEMVEGEISAPEEFKRKHQLDPSEPFLLVVQHPVTEEIDKAEEQVLALSEALIGFNLPKAWILPNNDAGSFAVRRALMASRTQETFVFDNLSRRDYLCLLQHSQAIVGNSSSGLLEAPTFKVPAVNIGRRQADRVQGLNVINASFDTAEIAAALSKALSPGFRASLENCVNPYGDGKSSERILDILQNTVIDDLLLIKRLMY